MMFPVLFLLLVQDASAVINDRVVTAKYTCDKLPYKDQCATGRSSQFTLRWFVMNGMCCSYPYSYCTDDDDTLTSAAIRTKRACEEICLNKSSSQDLQTKNALGANLDDAHGSIVNPYGGTPIDQITTTTNIPAVTIASCARLPYKETCDTGRSSQFVLRWFLMNGKCCTYPYGFCTGDDEASKTPAIRTKAECEELCLKRSTSDSRRNDGAKIVIHRSSERERFSISNEKLPSALILSTESSASVEDATIHTLDNDLRHELSSPSSSNSASELLLINSETLTPNPSGGSALVTARLKKSGGKFLASKSTTTISDADEHVRALKSSGDAFDSGSAAASKAPGLIPPGELYPPGRNNY